MIDKTGENMKNVYWTKKEIMYARERKEMIKWMKDPDPLKKWKKWKGKKNILKEIYQTLEKKDQSGPDPISQLVLSCPSTLYD